MNFISLEFLIFFVIIIAGLKILNSKHKKITFLVLSSYFFYAWWDVRFLIIQIFYTFFVYRIALYLGEKACGRKFILGIGIAGSVIILGYFKYYNFFVKSVNQIIGSKIGTLNVILPLGISFYIISAIGYMIDVYRGSSRCQRDFMYVALFVSYFPKITSGPIERADMFWNKLENLRDLDGKRFSEGIQLILSGIIKKMMIADRLGVCVDAVFAHPSIYSTPSIICAVISYAIQIYSDFSGYTDMARGISHIIGINLKQNFNLPYFAANPSDFFRRWHISLSEWMRDYIYISFGGSKRGAIVTYLNILLTMLISGLWHGANWTFVLWGVIHGLAQCFYRICKKYIRLDSRLAIGLNTVFVCLAWIVFRADDVSTAMTIYRGIFVWKEGINYIYIWTIIYAILLLVFESRMYRKNNGNAEVYFMNLEKWTGKVIFLLAVWLTCALVYMGDTAFIYNNF